MSPCDYCKGVGACPKCWGRSAITEIKAERDELLALVRELVERDDLDNKLRTFTVRNGKPDIPVELASSARALLARIDGGAK